MRIVVVADVPAADRVVLDLPAVDEAGGDAVGDAAERDEQGDAGDHECGRGTPGSSASRGRLLRRIRVRGLGPTNTLAPAIGAQRRRRPGRQRDHEAGAAALGVAAARRGRRGPRRPPHDREARGRCRRRRGSPPPRAKRSNMRSRRPAGTPGPRSATSSTAESPSRRTETITGVPGGRVDERVLDQVERQPVQVVGRRPRPSPGSGRSSETGGRTRAAGLGAASRATAARSTGAARRLAAGVGARQQQQVADQPAHPARRAQRGARPSRAARRRAPPRAARGWRGCW